MIDKSIQKSITTISEMLTDRGLVEEANVLMNLIIEDKPSFNIDIENTIRIIFNLNNKIKLADIKKFIEDEFEYYIIVLSDKLSPANMKSIHEQHKDVQVFEIKELAFNISKHSLVPKHTLITDEKEIAKLVSNYQLKSKTQFPIILKSDPMSKYLNAKTGNLVKILRYSPSAGEHVVYRCCI
jgi:DNA-directed RNA polymerase I, II, and III subunit RPABC1